MATIEANINSVEKNKIEVEKLLLLANEGHRYLITTSFGGFYSDIEPHIYPFGTIEWIVFKDGLLVKQILHNVTQFMITDYLYSEGDSNE